MTRNTVLINDSDETIADDEQDVRKMTASESLDGLNTMKYFAEIYGDK